MDPNNLNNFDTTNTYDHYDAFFQPDYDRYMRDYESYQHYMSLCEQEAEGLEFRPIRRRRYIYREREEVEERLIDDYFGDDEYEPKYLEETFRRRYREFTLSSLDVLQGFSFFLQMGFTLILATLDGLDVGLLGDVIGEDDCDDDG
ncbi:hypothetical protein Tco_0677438 [Tanacetum coccineum]|uniref:Uncharacterized protein n=1 Tax=Tanacetum coccineum TaxID=301880 RepID=A0ABQ4XC76_9ASTR